MSSKGGVSSKGRVMVMVSQRVELLRWPVVLGY